MTHFIGAVYVPPSVPVRLEGSRTKYPNLYGKTAQEVKSRSLILDAYLTVALETFNENTEVPRYVRQTREQAIESERKRIQDFAAGTYARYLDDPAAYIAQHARNQDHINFIVNEFPKELNLTDEELHAMAVKYEDEDDVDDEGNIYSTYNPNSKWDWWVIGGRWEESYRKRQGETIEHFREELLNSREVAESGKKLPWSAPYSLVIPGGEAFEWLTQGTMGWFGMSTEDMTDTEWIDKLLDETAKLDQGGCVLYIDFHI